MTTTLSPKHQLTAGYDEDPRNPPEVFFAQPWGPGMFTTGTHPAGAPEPERVGIPDAGELFGYCYQPVILRAESPLPPDGHPGWVIYSETTYSPYGYNPEVQGSFHFPGTNYGYHPYFSNPEDALKWLRDLGVKGHVLRYAHHRPVECRVPTWEYQAVCRYYHWQPYKPWITAGIVARYTPPKLEEA